MRREQMVGRAAVMVGGMPGTDCRTVKRPNATCTVKQRAPDASRRHSFLHSNRWTPAAVRRSPRRVGENKDPRRPTQIARACKGVLAPAARGTTPLQRQYARLFSKGKGAPGWAWLPRAPAAAAAAAAAAVRREEQLRCRRAELQELQDLLADRLLSEDNYVAEVKRVLEKDDFPPETGLSLLASLALPLRQVGGRQVQEETVAALQ